MVEFAKRQRTPQISEWIASYLLDCEAGDLSPRTLSFYADKLNKFNSYCNAANIGDVEELTPDDLRRFLLWLETLGHNPGGVHCHYRAVKTFVRWYIDEMEPESFKDPFRKVSRQKPTPPLMPPVPLEDVKAMVRTCSKKWYGIRDKAIVLCLLDTGARADEFLSFNADDINLRNGAAFIRKGKGRKSRTVFIGKTARRSLRRYLRTRNHGPLWTKQDNDRLAYPGLRQILRRRAEAAHVAIPSPHDFRRAFAVNMLRAGTDLETLRRLMGHSDLQVLRRYLALIDDDLRRAHAIASPADQLRNLNRRR